MLSTKRTAMASTDHLPSEDPANWPFAAVLFDCDGVLVDSETITNRVLRDMLEEIGWSMSLSDCMDFFVGKTVREERALIEAKTGHAFFESWLQSFYERRNHALQASLEVMGGALAAVQAAHKHCQGRIACASGADRFKIRLQLEKTGLLSFFEGRIFSGHEMPRSKPAPDVYLAAARGLGIDPSHCLVIEDTTVGIRAGVGAGALVWALSPQPSGDEALRQAGASRIFRSMAQLPDLWAEIGAIA